MAGNKNSGRRSTDTKWADAIRIAVHEEHVTGKPKIRELADVLVRAAINGDMTAMKEIGDRLDGKAKQTSDVNVSGDPLKALYDQIVDQSKVGDK